MKKTTIRKGKYQHYKGQFYQVIALATHSETAEKLVVYQPLYGDQDIWVRPYEMFIENLMIENKTVPRFKFISDE